MFFKGVCFWFLNSADVSFFRAKMFSMSPKFGITPRTLQDRMLNNLERAIFIDLGF